MDDGVGFVIFQGVQHGVDVGPGLVQKEKGHRGGHAAIILFLLAVHVVLVVLRHPGGNGDKFCPGRLDDSAEGFSGEISHPDAFLHQFGDEGQGGVDVPEGSKGYKRDVHNKILSMKNSHTGSAEHARTAAG